MTALPHARHRRSLIALAGIAALVGPLVAVAAPATAAPLGGPVAAVVAAQGSGPERDFSGDGIDDTLAISESGDLLMYRATGSGSLTGGVRIGTGWSGFDRAFVPGDFTGDGRADVMAINAAGDLFVYPGNGTGGWLAPYQAGRGWQGFISVFGAGDLNSDGAPDVAARDPQGQLLFYPGNGRGGWLTPRVIGTGFADFQHVVGAGDLDFDGRADVVSTPSANDEGQTIACGYDLHLYSGTGNGSLRNSGAIGSGWCTFTAVTGGDRVLIARDPSGVLWRYVRTGPSSWTTGNAIGSGFNSVRLVG
ncbi:FG-GAP repeat domain-containing protein [Agromyces indicus]|uniref:VCBS repeat-containing protein n=1 Tax=Agromyces indicus TaxID=758919 RepID=A0ABU1FGP3_9MICO|nr:VCBS repeat-containing protein [Agromyces indicus]MDR5690931.1 VCBS repeat-containing protein [Agromyces indicus]